MLPKANRITRPEDFREVSRRARRSSGQFMVVQVLSGDSGRPSRAGFIVSRSIGGAVKRNLVRRRLRAAFAEAMPHIGDGRDVVVRALPAAEGSTWSQLQAELRLLVTQSRTS